MPSTFPHIERYYEDLQRLQEYGGSSNELSIRRAFENCLDNYCRGHREKLALVAEVDAGRGIRPDGTVKDSLRMSRGYWEAKDTHDDLDVEIQKKFNRGYPRDNIIFEDSQTAVLFQNRNEAMRVDMSRPGELHRLIRALLDYELPEIEEFRQAQRQFNADLPAVLESLREAVEAAQADNPVYQAAAAEFLKLCRQSIGPQVVEADIREMLLQHILTKDIFLRVFAEDQFHRENNIARQLDALERTFFIGELRRNAIERLRAYYGAIGRAANEIVDYAEKQQFLKGIYEEFYKAYNPAAADYLGVAYTPNEVVDFIIRGVDYLLQKHFGRTLADDEVHILDPATGTGTFITNIINYLPESRMEYKYLNEIHANEVAILPYYIANLNIEYTYKERTGRYTEFPNLCFVDTLDNKGWQQQGSTAGSVERQGALDLFGLSEENWLRVQGQNDKPISVVIGNPPYNDQQRNWYDQNPNPKYWDVDLRIKDTYVAEGTAQRTHQYDMYKRFLRWSSDRLSDDGIIGFITNRSYLDTRQDDGFRKVAFKEFSDIYIMDLKSDVRRNPKISGTMHNVFGIQTGVAIGFFVRQQTNLGNCRIHYTSREDTELRKDKLAYLAHARIEEMAFENIVPDIRNSWLNQSNSDLDSLLTIAHRGTKRDGALNDGTTVFEIYSRGVNTGRDEWVYDFSRATLIDKALVFCNTYCWEVDRYNTEKPPDIAVESWVDRSIKWTSELTNHLIKGDELSFSTTNIILSLYRPYTVKHTYYAPLISHRRYRQPNIFPHDSSSNNVVIAFCSNGKQFYALASRYLPDYHLTGDADCLPLYRYTDDGDRVSNITDWGLQQFREHYEDDTITPEDIFAYTYAVLHDPVYRDKYSVDLLREFPRLPFYEDFWDWATSGQQLLDLHIGFEAVEPFGLKRVDQEGEAKRVFLRADKERGVIRLDDKTTLTGVPPEAWRYVLGSRSALEWVLDQYKEKKPRDPTIAEMFNTYRFADYKERVIELLDRVCAVSVRTMEIVDSMAHWEEGIGLVTYREREKETLFPPLWFDEPEDEEWLEELRQIWLETSSGSGSPEPT